MRKFCHGHSTITPVVLFHFNQGHMRTEFSNHGNLNKGKIGCCTCTGHQCWYFFNGSSCKPWCGHKLCMPIGHANNFLGENIDLYLLNLCTCSYKHVTLWNGNWTSKPQSNCIHNIHTSLIASLPSKDLVYRHCAPFRPTHVPFPPLVGVVWIQEVLNIILYTPHKQLCESARMLWSE